MINFWKWLTAVDFQTKRWMVDLRPDFAWRHGWVFEYGGDEYGNLSVYTKNKLFMLVFFYGRDVQRDVELPVPGDCAWVDRVFYELGEED